jgi:hypothetical protein
VTGGQPPELPPGLAFNMKLQIDNKEELVLA